MSSGPSEPNLRRRAAATGGSATGPVERLAGGDVSAVFRVGDRVIKIGDTPGLFAAEARGLTRLRAAGARAPEPLAVDDRALVLPYLAPGPRDDRALGEMLAALHAPIAARYGSPQPVFLGPIPLPAGEDSAWTPVLRELRLRPLLTLARPTLGAARHDRLARWLDRATFPEEGPCVVHGDLWSGNVLHTGDGPALIDPCAQIGERALDLAMMGCFGGFSPTVWATLEARRPVPAAVRAALPGTALVFWLAHVVLFGETYLAAVDGALAEAAR